MRQEVFTVTKNTQLTADAFEVEMEGNTEGLTKAGQFVQVQVPPYFLRRPISVKSWDDHRLKLVFKIMGKGTMLLAQLAQGDKVDLLTGLGNGFRLHRAPGHTPLLIGGGVGVPPLYALALQLLAQREEDKDSDKPTGKPVVVLGYNKKEEILLQKDFEELGCRVLLATVDGSVGSKGFVTDALKLWLDKEGEGTDLPPYVYSCGPPPMLKALDKMLDEYDIPGELSMEERMGCGIGACRGCTIETKKGPRRVCKAGPVFDRKVIQW